jgi:hypothetical protein
LPHPADIDLIKHIPLNRPTQTEQALRMKRVYHTATRPFSFKSRSTGSIILPAKDDASFFKFKNFANLGKKQIMLLSVSTNKYAEQTAKNKIKKIAFLNRNCNTEVTRKQS